MTRDARPFISRAYVQYTRSVYERLLTDPLTALPTLGASPLFLLMDRVWGGATDPVAVAVRGAMAATEAELWPLFRSSGLTVEQMVAAFSSWGSG